MSDEATAIQHWWASACVNTRRRLLTLTEVDPLPAGIAQELLAGGVSLQLGLFTMHGRVARRFRQPAGLWEFLASERQRLTTV